jgi:hypothetical protein
MEDLLYDYAQAKAMATIHTDSSMYYSEYYVALAFKKHNVTPQQFDSLMIYYSSRAEELHQMYVNIGKRLANDDANDKQSKDLYANKTDVKGDTLNIWKGPNAYMLHSLLNISAEFSESVSDSLIRRGDEIRLEFVPIWLSSATSAMGGIQHSPMEGHAVLAMVFENDTIITVKHRFFMSFKQDISTTVPLEGLKEIKGFFYQTGKVGAQPHVLFIMRPALLRFRGNSVPNSMASKPGLTPSNVSEPSVKVTSTSDSSSEQRKGLENVPLSKLQGDNADDVKSSESKQSLPASPTSASSSSTASSQKRIRDSLLNEDRERGRRKPL